ncbi:hypothetical protein ABI59_01110 [Acidobacteria bacterium Mor1]|nr:hypothetical protein ABI59_01110 [Acidobacteria bacterium Mor1]
MSDEKAHPERFGRDALLMRTWSDGEAALVRQLLEHAGIPCHVIADESHTVLPIAIDRLGETRIYVFEQDLRRARGLIAEHRRFGLRVVDGGRADEPHPAPQAEDPASERERDQGS